MFRTLGCFIVALVLGSIPVSGAPVPAASAVQEVVVYRGQALVTRAVAVPEGDGEMELIVSDLPEQIVGPSASASADGATGVTIRSVRFRARAVAEAPQKEIADLDAQIKALNRQVYANQQLEGLLGAKTGYVTRLEAFTAPTAQVEMAKGVLNPDTLQKVSEMVFALRSELTAEQIKLHEAGEDLKEQLALLQRKRQEIAGGGKTVREAAIFVSKAGKAATTIQLSYLVNEADWSPAYNLRLASDGKTVRLEYLAQVQQTSGEDWANVKLTLSTATPAMNAESPLLAPFWVGLTAGAAEGKDKTLANYAKLRSDTSNSQYAALGAWNTLQQAPEQAGWELNRLAATGQVLELNGELVLVRGGQEAARAVTEGLAVSYPLPGKMSLASRPDQQLVQIAAQPFAVSPYYVATPLLSVYVYRRANLVNTSPVPMLAGPYSAYIGGEFVGRGQMPLVACGQEVTVGFGVDTELRCHRELKDKSDKVSWGSRVQTFDYELRLENFKKTPVAVRLLDRIPASKGEDIQVRLLKTSQAVSTDAVYNRDMKDKGILRWDMDLAGEAAGAKVRRLEYTFEMKYAKDAQVGREATAMPAMMQDDLRQEMMKAAH